MADAPYLIVLALLEQNGQRALPLQGKSLRNPIEVEGDPGDIGRQQALELLARIWLRSEEGPLKRAAGDSSLLLAEVPIEALQEQLPQLKADWLNGGSSETLVAQLRHLASAVWQLKAEPRQPLRFERLP